MGKSTIFDTRTKSAGGHTPKRQTVQATTWLKPPVKSELEKIAKKEDLSVSAVIAALLEEAVRQKLYLQHAILLEPLIKKAIAQNIRQIATRLSWLLVRVAFDAGQTRAIAANILGHLPNVTPEHLRAILNDSAQSAKSNITRRTPQMTALMDEIEKWLLAGDLEKDHPR